MTDYKNDRLELVMNAIAKAGFVIGDWQRQHGRDMDPREKLEPISKAV